MDKFLFYKSIFEKEQTRRKDIDTSINQPITIASLFVGLMYFLYSKINLCDWTCLNSIIILTLILSLISLIICIYFLTLSFNNLYTGFKYLDLPKTIELHKYEMELGEYNKLDQGRPGQNFEDFLIEKFVLYSDNHIKINDKRSLNLYRAKAMLSIILILESLGLIIFFIK